MQVQAALASWLPKLEVGEGARVSEEEDDGVFHLGTKRLFQKSDRVKPLQLLMLWHS